MGRAIIARGLVYESPSAVRRWAAVTNPELSRLFEDYAAYHRHPMNKLTHYVAVPLIVITVVGLLSRVSLGPMSLAVPVAVAAVLYDLRLSVKLTLPFAAFIGVSFLVAPAPPIVILWTGFLGGWLLQFVGHFVYEKKSPAFFKNLEQLLVAPLWLIEEATRRGESARSSES